ncbi:MAG: NADPH-dependent F420 reductase [Pseudomonadales bacterium]|nr:NADPH-dependent F420 reductase [Pseudomonadales bacterium]
MTIDQPVIAILGGSGALGSGLAWRWAAAGLPVIIGSRNQHKAEAAVTEISKQYEVTLKAGLDNRAAAEAGDILVLTVPFHHQTDLLNEIKEFAQGKIFIDVTVPLVPPKVTRVQMPKEGSAALITQNILGENVNVVSAFQNVAAANLQAKGSVDCDVLVTGDDLKAREKVIELAKLAGIQAYHAGPLDNSVAAEALTSILIHINKRYKGHAGIRVSGLGSRSDSE